MTPPEHWGGPLVLDSLRRVHDHASRKVRGGGIDIGRWLRGLGLEQYEPAFRDNAIDAETLNALTAEDLRELGVAAIGHRKKLLAASAALEPAVPSPMPHAETIDVPTLPRPVLASPAGASGATSR